MLIIKNAHIMTMAGKEYKNGYILIEDGKIVKISDDKKSYDCDTIDACGGLVMPGMIDAHCHIGICEDGMGFEGDDTNENTDPVTPQLEAIDGINPFDRCFTEALEAGITTVVTGPGSGNVICGQFAALKTTGRCIEDMIVKAPIAMKIAFGENPKRVYSDKDETPSTRMGMAALLKENLQKAKNYVKQKDEAEENDEIDEPEYDYKLEALEKVIRKQIPLKAHAHRADDILTALRIAKQFDVDITIDHCTEGGLIVDELYKRNAKIILGPLMCERSKIELRNSSPKTAGLLAKAGLKIAFMTDHPVVPIQYLPVTAAIAVKEGMDELEALKAITINAAEIVGISDRVGSLEKGKDADIVIFDGHPLDVRSKVKYVLVNGEIKFKGND